MTRAAHHIIKRPLLTEKGTRLKEHGGAPVGTFSEEDLKPQVLFEVSIDANKIEIKSAIEALFSVKVVDVHKRFGSLEVLKGVSFEVHRGNVVSMIGSYTSIGYKPATADHPMTPGGDTYPGLIRKSPIRPVKIFLQDGTADLNNEHGNWHLANEQMLSSLQWANANADEKKIAGARYDIRYEWGDGAHSDVHGGWLLPGILRWMFGK